MFTRRRSAVRRPAGNNFGGRSGFSGNRGGFGGGRGGRFAPKQLDTRLFIRSAIDHPIDVQLIENMFSDFEVHPQILKNLESKGYTTPTPIQDQALKPGLAGKDVIGLADTGTGKTTAFVLPILNKIMANPNQNALIMAPTRELAVQIREEIRSIAEGMPIYSFLLMC